MTFKKSCIYNLFSIRDPRSFFYITAFLYSVRVWTTNRTNAPAFSQEHLSQIIYKGKATMATRIDCE